MQQNIPELEDIIEYLNSQPSICDVKLNYQLPISQDAAISEWEKRNLCIFPEDIKNFYLTTNGLHLSWSMKIGDSKMHIGKIEINELQNIRKLVSQCGYQIEKPSLRDLDFSDLKESGSPTKADCEIPGFACQCCKLFELEHLDGDARVVLAYQHCKPGSFSSDCRIWLMDRSFNLHHISHDFTHYFRLLLLHLGLPQWQFLLTDLGISPQAAQYYYMFAPSLLRSRDEMLFSGNCHASRLFDPNKVFKSRTDKKNNTLSDPRRNTATAPIHLKGKKPLPAVGSKISGTGGIKAPGTMSQKR